MSYNPRPNRLYTARKGVESNSIFTSSEQFASTAQLFFSQPMEAFFMRAVNVPYFFVANRTPRRGRAPFLNFAPGVKSSD